MTNIEKLKNNKIKISFKIERDELEKGIEEVYQEEKSSISIPGFRKGKVPKKIIENFYGKNFFFEDALNKIIPKHYENTIKENNIDAVSKPEINIGEIVEGDSITIFAEVYIKPEVKIESYKGVRYVQPVYEVTDNDIEQRIDQDRQMNSRIITVDDRPIKDKDLITLDFEGFINGVPFEGGKAKDYELEIGSKTFIDNFEDQLINHSINEEFDVNVNFPDDYTQEELQGKPAKFIVKINSITETQLPELDDDFAQDVSEFDTFIDYRNNIADEIGKSKAKSAETQAKNAAMEKLIGSAEIDLPEIMVTNQVAFLLNDASESMEKQGLDMNSFLQFTNQTIEEYSAQYYDIARSQVIGRLILEEIAKRENINISEEEIDKEIDLASAEYNIEKDKFIKMISTTSKADFELDIKVQKAMKFVMDNAIAEEPDESNN